MASSYSRFNLRVYGLWIKDKKILVNREIIKNIEVVKFPGGGVELGEGLHQALIREWKEELETNIIVQDLFYVNTFLQPSAFDASQVVSFYFWVKCEANQVENKNENETSLWMPIHDLQSQDFSLPIDKIVVQNLGKHFQSLTPTP